MQKRFPTFNIKWCVMCAKIKRRWPRLDRINQFYLIWMSDTATRSDLSTYLSQFMLFVKTLNLKCLRLVDKQNILSLKKWKKRTRVCYCTREKLRKKVLISAIVTWNSSAIQIFLFPTLLLRKNISTHTYTVLLKKKKTQNKTETNCI